MANEQEVAGNLTATFDDYEQAPAVDRKPVAETEPSVVVAPKSTEVASTPVDTPVVAVAGESEVETKARATGWVPLSEWKRNPANWVPADKYLANEPFAKQINSYKQSNERQTRLLRERDEQIQALTKQYALVHDAAYTKALKDLTAAKKQAVADGDTERVERIDEAITTTRTEQAASRAPEFRPTFVPDAALQHWADTNQDILTDPDAAPFAASYDQNLMSRFPQMDLAERLEKVTQATKRAFPEKFPSGTTAVPTPTNPRTAPALVESAVAGSGSGRSKLAFTVDSLTADERAMMLNLEKSGIKREDYIKDIQFVRENPNQPVYFE